MHKREQDIKVKVAMPRHNDRLTLREREEDLFSRLQHSIRAAQKWLLNMQHEDGYWVAELEGDTILESEYALLYIFLGLEKTASGRQKIKKLANHIRSKQLSDGGWGIYPGAPKEISVSVKAYFVLKLAGFSASLPFMQKARQAILEMGGVIKTNSFTKIYLSIFGQYDWNYVPAIPPEIILMPNWFYFNIYAISAWSRTILVPLSIIWAYRPVCSVPKSANIDELFVGGREHSKLGMPYSSKIVSWRNFFLGIDTCLKLIEKSSFRPLRSMALAKAFEWIVARFEKSDGLGAIFPPMVNAVMALSCLGYGSTHPLVATAINELEALEIEEEDTLRIQPCLSPVWDTALGMVALSESGLDAHNSDLVRAGEWLVEKSVTQPGDWKILNPKLEPGGWYFEFENEFYPDIDDTAIVLLALSRVYLSDDLHKQKAVRAGLNWLLGMQCKNGGWAAFDRDNNREIFCHVPFADHNAMLDPASADITGRVLEMLAAYGYDMRNAPAWKAVQFLRSSQEPDGSWYGRWGVNYIYGTWQVLKGLRCIGEDMSEEYCQKAARWLRSVQNADGGWGESCHSYDDISLKARGQSTASQTAWALMGLFASGDSESLTVRRGVEYLLRTQKNDGAWDEDLFTGTGFPRVFYLKYHYYKNYFPIFALGMYLRMKGARSRVFHELKDSRRYEKLSRELI